MLSLQHSLCFWRVLFLVVEALALFSCEWRPAYWPVVFGNDGDQVLWEQWSMWNWEVCLKNGRWRGHEVTLIAFSFPAADFNFEVSVLFPWCWGAQNNFSIQVSALSYSHTYSLKACSHIWFFFFFFFFSFQVIIVDIFSFTPNSNRRLVVGCQPFHLF